MSGRAWFTSDHHFGHANILKHCSRRFGSVAEMDAELVARWNAVVQPGDTVWHLGDFCFRSGKSAEDYLRRLNGNKHLVHGNHDDEKTRKARGWATVQDYAEVVVDGIRLVLFHYSLRAWNRAHHGAVQLYGHSHGTLPGDSQSCDVGVDCWDFAPVSLGQVRERLAVSTPRFPVDHHGGDR